MRTELLRLLADPAVRHAALIFAGCVALAGLTFFLGRVTRSEEVAAAEKGERHAYAELGRFMAKAAVAEKGERLAYVELGRFMAEAKRGRPAKKKPARRTK